jgi:hypothetical protein
MSYLKTYQYFKNTYKQETSLLTIPSSEIEIRHISFSSQYWTLLPGASSYKCDEHDMTFQENPDPALHADMQSYPEVLKHADTEVGENKHFTYTLFKNRSPVRTSGVILLFHGLNERGWTKYLPWAERLVENTGKSVVLFPIAFHMNRAPASWGHSREMNLVSGIRRGHSPKLTNSTYANAAISARIELIPQRFFWSGLQTFYDIVALISDIRNGAHPFIAPDASFDLFGYSIGSFLSEILIMASPKNFFQNSRLFLFCGGPTLDRMCPNSRFILDSDATIAIYSYYTERLEMEMKLDRRIAHYFRDAHPAGIMFRAMLSYQKEKEKREELFKKLQGQLRAVALKKDTVVPPGEVLNTLQGEYRDINTKVEILDFPYPYTHIDPFPATQTLEHPVDCAFNSVFEKASEHLR